MSNTPLDTGAEYTAAQVKGGTVGRINNNDPRNTESR